MNYARLSIAWVQFIGMVLMILCTVRSYRTLKAVRDEKRGYMAYRRLGCRARCAAAFDELRRHAAVER